MLEYLRTSEGIILIFLSIDPEVWGTDLVPRSPLIIVNCDPESTALILTISLSTWRKSPFDRDKLSKSIYIALKKRPIDTDTIEKFITKISRSLEELGQSEITSNTVGTMVMDGLKELDPVAYVRFASVYRNFREEKDFVQFVDKLNVIKNK